MLNLINRIFTKNYKEVPLLWVTFNLPYYKEKGVKGSCMAHMHPTFKDDKHIKNELGKLIDYIRENYDMEKLCK